jgi:hypothetical protein
MAKRNNVGWGLFDLGAGVTAFVALIATSGNLPKWAVMLLGFLTAAFFSAGVIQFGWTRKAPYAIGRWVKGLVVHTVIWIGVFVAGWAAWPSSAPPLQVAKQPLAQSRPSPTATLAPGVAQSTPVPFDCQAEAKELNAQYRADSKNIKEGLPTWLNRQIRERRLPCKMLVNHPGKQKPAELPTLVHFDHVEGGTIERTEGGKIDVEHSKDITTSDINAGHKTPTPPL